MANQTLVSRTHFTKSLTKNEGWQWFWATKALNDVDTIGVGGEGYHNLVGAQNGFFAQQGDSDWKPGDPIPPQYRWEKIDANHYVCLKFETTE